MDELLEQLYDAYSQTGTDFYDDAFNCTEEDADEYDTDEFIRNLELNARKNRPRTYRQIHPVRKKMRIDMKRYLSILSE